jgi:hypothetical protein
MRVKRAGPLWSIGGLLTQSCQREQRDLPALQTLPSRAPVSRPQVRSRQIVAADIERVVALLARGFPLRAPSYWHRALQKLAAHRPPPGMPRFGYLLEYEDEIVGVILLLFAAIPGDDTVRTRCNVSSWYVEPAFRSHASLLIAQALRFKDVTYLNISPAEQTQPVIAAQGFARYNEGQFAALPALSMREPPGGAMVVDVDAAPVPHRAAERDLLIAHKQHGCIALWCVSNGDAHPFVFLPRAIKGLIPAAQLVYCRHVRDFVRLAAPLGRYLLAQGRGVVIIDADGPIPGLAGRYFPGKSLRYFKGPERPHLGDLAFTEVVLFGL